MASQFKADVILVLGHERLSVLLKQQSALAEVEIVPLPKSGGVRKNFEILYFNHSLRLSKETSITERRLRIVNGGYIFMEKTMSLILDNLYCKVVLLEFIGLVEVSLHDFDVSLHVI